MDREQLEQVYAKESGKMRVFIRRHIHRRIDIFDEMDILQETFYTLLDGIDLLRPVARPIDNIVAYVYRALRNKIIDYSRKPVLEFDGQLSPDELAAQQPLLTDDLEAQQLMASVWSALEQLPEQQKWVFVQTEFEGHSFKALAASTGLSINTLLSQKHYALKKLKSLLSDEGLSN